LSDRVFHSRQNDKSCLQLSYRAREATKQTEPHLSIQGLSSCCVVPPKVNDWIATPAAQARNDGPLDYCAGKPARNDGQTYCGSNRFAVHSHKLTACEKHPAHPPSKFIRTEMKRYCHPAGTLGFLAARVQFSVSFRSAMGK
jgi:hypothetical protein